MPSPRQGPRKPTDPHACHVSSDGPSEAWRWRAGNSNRRLFSPCGPARLSQGLGRQTPLMKPHAHNSLLASSGGCRCLGPRWNSGPTQCWCRWRPESVMSRAAVLAGLRSCDPELLPFVHFFSGGQSSYCWWDAEGRWRDMARGEGCEQENPWRPCHLHSGNTRPCLVRPLHFILPRRSWRSLMTFTLSRPGAKRGNAATQ